MLELIPTVEPNGLNVLLAACCCIYIYKNVIAPMFGR